MSVGEHTSSDRYQQLLQQYREMHANGERFIGLRAEDTFPGESLLPHADNLKGLFAEYGVGNCLDYGSGKGRQYTARLVDKNNRKKVYQGLGEYWGVDVSCYDPAYPPYAVLPDTRFDAVLCTDVLEHCAQEDVDWIIGEIFSRARTLVYISIACYPAQKRLPNGENTHVTVKDPQWWTEIIEKVASSYSDRDYVILFEHDEKGRGGAMSYIAKGVKTAAFARSALAFDKSGDKGQGWFDRLKSSVFQ